MLIQQEIDLIMRTYAKGLSGQSKETLYNALQLSKKHTQACSQAVRLIPMHAILMSIVLEQQKQLRWLTEEIMDLTRNRGIPV